MIELESAISVINRHPDQDLLAVGGKSFTKLVRLTDFEFKLQKNLKIAKSSNKVGTTDLQWNNFYNTILASTTINNSSVLIWDTQQSSHEKLSTTIGQHDQIINRINWNYKNHKLLASCSQDGYLKIFDFKDIKGEVISMNHKEKIRDCQFSPFSEYEILASYNSGLIKLWDTRKYDTIVKQFIKHESDVLSVDWHPLYSGIFASGSTDKNLYIWDINKNIDNESSKLNIFNYYKPDNNNNNCDESYFIAKKNCDNYKLSSTINNFSNNIISYPILSYKTNFGTSRVKWFKRNPIYIITSYQTNNNFTSMWNTNIQNMPEYIYKGHKEVVTSFCLNFEETHLITVSKDAKILLHDLSQGFRPLDNFFTNFSKLVDESKLIYYTDKIPEKKSILQFNHDLNNVINYNDNNESRIKANFTKDSVFLNINDNSNLNIINNDNYAIKKTSFCLNFISFTSNFTYNKTLVHDIFRSYRFVLNTNYVRRKTIDNIDSFPSLVEQIRSVIDYNTINSMRYSYSNHYMIFSELQYLSQSSYFEGFCNLREEQLSTSNSKNNSKKVFSSFKNFQSNNISDNVINSKKINKKLSNDFSIKKNTKNNESSYILYDVLKNNILEIINFLIEMENDIILATLVIYIFQDVFDFDIKLVNRVTISCIEYIRGFELHTPATALIKFSKSNLIKSINKKNSLILMTCKNCNYKYDASKTPLCNNCENNVKCIVCGVSVVGLMYWNPNCSHGGHVSHMEEWYSKNSKCPNKCN